MIAWLVLAGIGLWALIRLGRQGERPGRADWRVAATLFGAVLLGGGVLVAFRGAWLPAVGLFGAGLDIGDDHRATSLRPGHAAPATAMAAPGVHRTPPAIGAGFAAGLAGGIELGTADRTVVIGVQTIETGVGAAGHAGLHGGAALIGRDRAVAVGVNGGQSLHAPADEFSLADAVVAVGVRTHAPGRSLLGKSSPRRGEGQNGETADQEGLFHRVVSMAGNPARFPVWRMKRRRCQSPSRGGARTDSKAARAVALTSISRAFRASKSPRFAASARRRRNPSGS